MEALRPDEIRPAHGVTSTVLLVEDDPDTSDSLKAIIEGSLEGVRVVTAPRASEALDALERYTVDLVLADYRLPGRDGLEVLREVNRRRPGVPGVLLTGYGDVNVAAQAINEVRVKGFFPKPFDHEALLATIRRLVPARSGRPGRIPPTRRPGTF